MTEAKETMVANHFSLNHPKMPFSVRFIIVAPPMLSSHNMVKTARTPVLTQPALRIEKVAQFGLEVRGKR